MLKGRSWFYGDKIEERRLNDCVTSLRHHNDVRSLTTNSIIDQHYFSSVSFRILILDNNEVMHAIFLLQLYSMVIFIVEIDRYITLIWYWMYIIFPLCFSSILRNYGYSTRTILFFCPQHLILLTPKCH